MSQTATTLLLGIPVLNGDVLRFNVYSNASVNIKLNINIVSLTGQIQLPVSLEVNATARSGTSNTQSFVNPGLIVSASCQITKGTVPTAPGNIYVEAYVERGLEGANTAIATVLAGYFWNGQRPSYPGDFVRPLDGHGRVYTVNASPAAGADISQAVPANARWLIKGIRAKLVASSAVATRTPSFQITDGTNTLYNIVPGGGTALNVTASQTRTFQWNPGYSVAETAYDSNNEVRMVGLPAILYLPAAAVFQSTTGSIAAADAYTVFIDVEEWIST